VENMEGRADVVRGQMSAEFSWVTYPTKSREAQSRDGDRSARNIMPAGCGEEIARGEMSACLPGAFGKLLSVRTFGPGPGCRADRRRAPAVAANATRGQAPNPAESAASARGLCGLFQPGAAGAMGRTPGGH
jgi:hypothetical protein